MTSKDRNRDAEAIWSGSITTAQTDENLAVVSRIWNDVWNRGDLEASHEIFSKDYLGHLPMTSIHGPDEFNGLVGVYRVAFPDVHLSVEDAFAVGDRVTVRWVSRGTHMAEMMGIPASHNKIEVSGLSIFRMESGKVAEEWENFDALGMMQTIGAIPSAGGARPSLMDNQDTVRKYYEYANAGKWDAWCDLFSDDMLMDEQLAGRIEGLATLRPMMAGMGQAYAKFQNELKNMVVEGDEGAVLSHISALAAKYPGEPIEADVMNYFRFRAGKICYMRNVHDTKPFAPFVRQISGG
ncbi:MAG: ester cyclase [Chloroflexota bacterium]